MSAGFADASHHAHHGYSSNTLLAIHSQALLHECNRLLMAVHPGHSLHYFRGDGEIRTHDPLLARQVLSQLSYTPVNSGSHLLSHIVSNAVPSAV